MLVEESRRNWIRVTRIVKGTATSLTFLFIHSRERGLPFISHTVAEVGVGEVERGGEAQRFADIDLLLAEAEASYKLGELNE